MGKDLCDVALHLVHGCNSNVLEKILFCAFTK